MRLIRTLGVSFAAGVLIVMLAATAPVLAAAPCPNEQLRTESNVNPTTGQPYSTQLSDCRAYELVSPQDTGGMPAILGTAGLFAGRQFLVTPSGSVFFESQATPAGTGALPDGGYLDVFRSRRAASGWATRDMLASTQAEDKVLEAASADGSSVLIETPLALSPEDVDNPSGNVTQGKDLYVVRDDGTPPEFVTHGEVPNRPALGQAQEGLLAATNADLSAVGFITNRSLARPRSEQELVTSGCYVWANVENRLARLTNPNAGSTLSPALNCKYFAVATDGRAIIEDTSGDAQSGLIFAADPGAISLGFPHGGTRQLSGNTPEAAKFDAMSPDDETVYITTIDPLVPNADAGADIYSVDLTKTGLSGGRPPEKPALTCISCGAEKGKPNEGRATYVGQSADGSHVFFTVAGALYEHDSAGTRPVAPAVDGVLNLVFSHNGQHVIATTSAALSASDTNGAPDIYEFADGSAPQRITNNNAPTPDSIGPVAVSDDGQRVLYGDTPNGAPSVIDEWVAGQTGQVSPAGSTHSYNVLGTTAPALEDVFFAANEPLVPQDLNAGTTDIYDARIDGGFPAPTEPANGNQTPNPTGPPAPAYTTNLTAPTIQLASLPADTSNLVSASKSKPLPRAQRLAKALKTCKKTKSQNKRAACVRHARKEFGQSKKKK